MVRPFVNLVTDFIATKTFEATKRSHPVLIELSLHL